MRADPKNGRSSEVANMFKNIRRLLIAMMLVMAFCVSAYAAGETKVLIKNVDENGAQLAGVTMHIEDESGNVVGGSSPLLTPRRKLRWQLEPITSYRRMYRMIM